MTDEAAPAAAPEPEDVVTVEIVERVGVTLEEAEAVADERIELTPHVFRRPWMRAFIAILARSGEVGTACRSAKINYYTARDHRLKDPVFAEAWQEALEVAFDLTEQEIRRRAITGTDEVVRTTVRKFQLVPGQPQPNGQAAAEVLAVVEEVVTERTANKKSDALLMFMAKAQRPEKFREHPDESQRAPDGPIRVEVYRFPDLDRAAALAELMAAEAAEREHPDVEGSTNGHTNGASPELPAGE